MNKVSKIEFSKMQSLGNDFIIIDTINQNLSLTRQQIRKLAHRHYGIGFDQCLIIEPPHDDNTDFFCRIFNADGSDAGQCGNGARCVARYITDHHTPEKSLLKLATFATQFQAHMHTDHSVTVEMGTPKLHPKDIPLQASEQSLYYKLPLTEDSHIQLQALNVGNPHAVITVDNVHEAPVAALGSALTKHPHFSQGVNVGFMQIINRNHLNLRVYERGVGETLACGSGACAAVVAGRLADKLDPKVTVNLPGGSLKIIWENLDSPVLMTGSAEYVFQGIINL